MSCKAYMLHQQACELTEKHLSLQSLGQEWGHVLIHCVNI